MQRAREGVLWLRGTRGILPNEHRIVQNGPQKSTKEKRATKKHKKHKGQTHE
jgi:hypothetical protein